MKQPLIKRQAGGLGQLLHTGCKEADIMLVDAEAGGYNGQSVGLKAERPKFR